MPPHSSSQDVRRCGREVGVMASEAVSWHRAYRVAKAGHPPDARRRTPRSPRGGPMVGSGHGSYTWRPCPSTRSGRPHSSRKACPCPSSPPKAWSRSTGRRKSEVRALDGLDLTVEEGTRPRSARARTAPARRRPCASSRRCCGPTPGARRSPASTSSARPQQLRSVIGLSGQYAAVDENLTGRENLWMFGRLYQLLERRGASGGPTSCSSSSTSTTPPTGSSRPTPAACAAGSTSPAR